MVGTAVASVLVAIGVVVFWLVRPDGGDADPLTPTWNGVVTIDTVSGALAVLDERGEEVTTVDGAGRVTEVYPRGSNLALVGSGQLSLVDLRSGGRDPLLVPLDRALRITRLPTNRSLTLLAHPRAPGNLVIVDGVTGAQLDVGAIAGQSAPLLFPDSLRSDRAARSFAVGDGRNFQTVVVRFGENEATFYPGVPMALDGDVVVTSTNVGNRAELGFFEADGDRLGSVDAERPVGGVLGDGRFVFVSERGAVMAARPTDRRATELATISVPAGDQVRWVRPALDGERLVVAGDRFEAIVDLDGTTLHQLTFTAERAALEPWATWRCVPVGGTGAFQAIIDLRDGAVIADLDNADVVAVSTDGCGVQVERDGQRALVAPAGKLAVPEDTSSLVLAPDGSAAVLVGARNDATLVRVGDDDDLPAPVALGRRSGTIVFVER